MPSIPKNNKRESGDLFDHEDDSRKKAPVKEKIPVQKKMPVQNQMTAEKESASPQETAKIDFSENAMKVLEKRYLKKDEHGKVIETPIHLFKRVAHCIASADALYDPTANTSKTEEIFLSMMTKLEFLPNSPTLMNADRELGQLSACFVLPVEDSMESIFEAVKNTALIHKSGGGTGFSFSKVRPQNDIVNSTKGIASGPISFLQVFDAATETVKQGGTRRGANMAILRVDHPDILRFISCKDNNDKLNNFNISVSLTEEFWNALTACKEYKLINPHSGESEGALQAKDVFDRIVQHAWKNGDPGIVFIDRINEDNMTPHLGDIEATNPCGEQPLLPYESCNLGSINLSRMVKEGGSGRTQIDYEKLLRTVRSAVHFLDNVIDLNKYPLPKIEKQTKTTRKIGLGVMGFADLLIQLDIPYDSLEAIEIAHQVMEFINTEAKKKSQELALKRGEFPAFHGSRYDQQGEPLIRNATRTTIAPTGTISIIAGCSSGIEPLYALSYTRHVLDGEKLPEIHPLVIERLRSEKRDTEATVSRILKEGSMHSIEEIPENIRKVFVTAHDIGPVWHIRMQAAFQQHTDNAVSKTVNFSHSATIQDVADAYRLAHDLRCKGITIYRDGSRDAQVLNKGKSGSSAEAQTFTGGRPKVLHGVTFKLNTGQGSLYVTINTGVNGEPLEVFANIGKSGGDTAALAEAIGRLISIALQKGVKVDEIASTLIGITGSKPVWFESSLIKSVPDGIGQILLNEFGNTKKQFKKPPTQTHLPTDAGTSDPKSATGPECPECSSPMALESGCNVCYNCGYSHCS